MTRVTLFEFMPYGAPELLEGSRPSMARALTLGSVFWCALFATTFAILSVMPKPVAVRVAVRAPIDLGDYVIPKYKTDTPNPVVPTQTQSPDQGTIAPVPESAVIPPSSEVQTSGTGSKVESGAVTTPAGGGPVEFQVDPDQEYHPYDVDVLPDVVSSPKPIYPELAKVAGVEGLVVVEVAIGPDGHVRRARVLKSVLLLDSAALEAARRWVFTPALTNGHPVTVLSTIPFRFSLH